MRSSPSGASQDSRLLRPHHRRGAVSRCNHGVRPKRDAVQSWRYRRQGEPLDDGYWWNCVSLIFIFALEKVLTLGCGKTTLDSCCVHISSYTNLDASGAYIRSIDDCFSGYKELETCATPLGQVCPNYWAVSCNPVLHVLDLQSLPDFASSPPSLRTGSVCGFSGASRGDLIDLWIKPRTVSSEYFVEEAIKNC